MKVKNNYNNCLTNAACSIRKYFDLPYAHNTLPEIDEVLEKKSPENVIVFLLDGMGSNILKRNIPDEKAFFRKNTVKTLCIPCYNNSLHNFHAYRIKSC